MSGFVASFDENKSNDKQATRDGIECAIKEGEVNVFHGVVRFKRSRIQIASETNGWVVLLEGEVMLIEEVCLLLPGALRCLE